MRLECEAGHFGVYDVLFSRDLHLQLSTLYVSVTPSSH